MSEQKAPAKLKDKWRQKKWYVVIAPAAFGNVELGKTMADDPQKLIGRVLETTLYNITEDFSQLHIKLYFKIVKVEGDKAYTIFKGHDLARDYLRSLVRRGSSRIDGIYPITSKDGYRMRIGILAISTVRTKSSQKHAIRRIMEETVKKKDGQLLYDELAPTARPWQDRLRDLQRCQICLSPKEDRGQEERACVHRGTCSSPCARRFRSPDRSMKAFFINLRPLHYCGRF
jgi:small subunit ribosomal protein S3Ae